MKKRTILGLSAGSGILMFPFTDLHILGNIETRSDYYISGIPDQWNLNFSGSLMWNDKHGYTAFNKLEVDIVVSQPKCGNSSMLALSRGKKMTSHKGEPSLDLSMAGIKHLSPKVFLLENLPALLDTYSVRDLQEYFSMYHLVFHNNVSMAKFGNSQKTRKRLIIIGVRKNLRKARDIRYHASEITPMNDPIHVEELITNPPENGHFRPPINERIAIYGGKQMTYEQIQKMWQSMPGKKRIATPHENFNTAPGVYRDLSKDFPATVRKSNRCFAPSGLPYTPRERARIMGLPDDFYIADPKTHPHLSPKTLFNKGCTATTQGPPYEVGLWFRDVLLRVNFL